MKKYIAYYRVSRKEQGISGLGLSAQKTSVTNFVRNQEGTIIQEFTEIETGTNKRERVEIHRAIELAKIEGAILVIAKLDRLSRNVNFVSSLMDAGIEFVAVDMPSANHFTIHIFSALAEQEAKLISSRTRLALTELKKKGSKLARKRINPYCLIVNLGSYFKVNRDEFGTLFTDYYHIRSYSELKILIRWLK